MESCELTELERGILNLIGNCRGKGNAIRRRNLVEMLSGVATDRRIREVIKHLTLEHGIPIASTPAGYFTPVTLEEIWRACDYYHSYAMAHLAVESKLRKLIDQIIGQEKIKFATEGTENTESAR